MVATERTAIHPGRTLASEILRGSARSDRRGSAHPYPVVGGLASSRWADPTATYTAWGVHLDGGGSGVGDMDHHGLKPDSADRRRPVIVAEPKAGVLTNNGEVRTAHRHRL
jgi:hypothetical protein